MDGYQIGQRVEATVEQVLSFGIFVCLDDNTRAYIRRRELDLDADVEPSQVVREGNKIVAEVIALGEPGKHIELSRRATLADPWPEFAQRFREGAVVRGTVQALHTRGVFVHIEAGVNGFVPLEELATWKVGKPEEVLWVGDEVEAVITRLDVRAKKLGLSIKARLEKRDQAAGILERLAEKRETEFSPEAPKETLREEFKAVDAGACERIGQIVVVDDHDEVRSGLVDWLQRHGYHAVGAKTVPEALVQIQRDNSGVLFVDLNLPDGDGLELVRQVRSNGNRARVCVISSPEWLMERATEIKAAGVTQVFEKPLDVDAIEHFLIRLGRGESVPSVWRATPRRISGEIGGLREFFGSEQHAVPPRRRLQTAVEKLTETTRAEKGILFAMDPTSHAISMIAEAGTLALNRQARYELEDSPVKDVIVEGEPVFDGQATGQGRFGKLLDLLTFESCIGVPIEVTGEVTHAVFFFHRKKDAFPPVRLRTATIGAIWFSAILEAQALDQRMHSASPLLLSGELSVSFAHEVYNKVSGLELQLRNLLPVSGVAADLQASLATLQNSVLDLKTVVESFQQRMGAKDTPTTFDVNAVVRRAEILLRPLARKERAKIILHLADSLPWVTGNSIALQQVFLNIMLNAVQQMALKRDGRRILEITTTCEGDRCEHPIKVRFADTGPGIHKRLEEKIFALGFSTRGGSGLGLFIARSLVDLLGGKILVEESFVPIGATFLVELPVAKQGEVR